MILVEGVKAHSAIDQYFHSANRRQFVDQHPNRIVYGRWGSASGEDVIACSRGLGTVEIHCHGGTHSSQKILEDHSTNGMRPGFDANQHRHRCRRLF